MKKAIILIVLIPMLIFGAWFFTSPYITLKRFGSALERGDADEVSKYIDYQALKEDFKKDLKTLLAKEMAKQEHNGEIEAFVLAFGEFLINAFVEMAVSPEGLTYIMEKGRMPTEEVAMQNSEGEKPEDMKIATDYTSADTKEEVETSASYKGINTFVYHIRDKGSKEGIDLIFERRGLANWKLVGIDFHFKE